MDESQISASDRVFHHLLSLIRYTRQYGRQMMDESGLTPRDFSVLRYLWEVGPATVGQVQAFIHNSPSTTSTLVAQLEGKGYLTRTRSQVDQRVVIVELTGSGQLIAEATPLGGLPLLRRRLSHLPLKRLMEFEAVLTEIRGLMEAEKTG